MAAALVAMQMASESCGWLSTLPTQEVRCVGGTKGPDNVKGNESFIVFIFGGASARDALKGGNEVPFTIWADWHKEFGPTVRVDQSGVGVISSSEPCEPG